MLRRRSPFVFLTHQLCRFLLRYTIEVYRRDGTHGIPILNRKQRRIRSGSFFQHGCPLRSPVFSLVCEILFSLSCGGLRLGSERPARGAVAEGTVLLGRDDGGLGGCDDVEVDVWDAVGGGALGGVDGCEGCCVSLGGDVFGAVFAVLGGLDG